MKRLLTLALLAIALAACSHDAAPPSTAAVPKSTEAGSVPRHYRRAYPVALPVAWTAAPASPALTTNQPPFPVMTADASTNSAEASPPPSLGALPPDANATAAATSPAVPADPGSAAASHPPTPAPAPAQPEIVHAVPYVAPSAGLPIPAANPQAFDPNEVVVIETTFGRMVIELDDFAAPKTCLNFRQLVSQGFYNGTIFHRVIPQFIIQGGDPNTKLANRASYGLGDPGFTLPPEIKLQHDRGAVAMARLPDTVNPQRYSNGSQFYICVAACPSLDNQYTVFGHVIAGMDVADRISAQPADRRADPLERIEIRATLEARDRALRENASAGP